MSSGGVVEQVDAGISAFFSAGNFWTLVLTGILAIVLVWPLFTGQDPDIHPFLLARQAQASPVRQPGESAVYRANEIPYGFPLRKGLGVKDPGAPTWGMGRDGDLRDIWRKASQGAVDDKGTPLGKKGRFRTILGQNVSNQSVDEVTQTINAIGGFIQKKGAKTVAVSLSNSVELLAVIFASVFYGFKPVLIPYGLESAQLEGLLSKIRADVLVAEAATVNLSSAAKSSPSIKTVIWVVKEGSRHIDWTEKPAGAGKIDISQWHDVVAENRGSSEVPASEKDSKTGPIVTFCKGKGSQYELIEYPSSTIVAGVGGLLSTLTGPNRLSYKDTFLSTASLTESYPLCWALASIYSNANIALNSVAGESVDLTLVAKGVSPTIVVSSSGTILDYHKAIASDAPGLSQQISQFFQKRNMKSGYMTSSKPSGIPSNLSALRLLLISQRGGDRARVASSVIAALRLALGTRVAYALTSGPVAGAVSQTSIFDYRDKGSTVCVGVPLTSLELYVTGDEQDLDQDIPKGKIAVKGPAVVGGKADLDVSARIDHDRTVALL